MSKKSQQNKWKKTMGQIPNFKKGSDLDKLLNGLQQLQSHYEAELQKEKSQIDVLHQALAKWEVQKNSRKVDPNG